MKILQKIFFALLMTIFLPSCSTTPIAYAGSCFEAPYDAADCRVKAEQGDAQAQYNLGVMYSKGQGVLQDDKEAVKWYRKAAEQGNAEAQFNLGLLYEKGQGVPKDYVMAHMYYNIAAVSGNTIAIENRGLIEKEMTATQIAEAQKLAREWVSKH
jgi:uncharacterized protein